MTSLSATTGSDPAVDLAATVGRNLRRLRTRQGYSLERLAVASGVSRAMLGQIENGKSTPTISLLWKIATTLGVPFATLTALEQGHGISVIRRENAKILTSDEGLCASRALFPIEAKRNTEFYELRIAANHTVHSEPHAPGTIENLVVTQGTVEIGVGQERPVLLGEGDALFFQADVDHTYRNLRATEAVIYMVTTFISPVGGA